MTRQCKPIIVAALIATASVALTGCGTSVKQRIRADMTKQSDAYQAWWSQKMIYHANSEVYFDPYSRMYYWAENGQWNESATLPGRFSLRDDTPKIVTRARMLSDSKNAPEVQAFNPYFTHAAMRPASGTGTNWQPAAESDFDFNDFIEGFNAESGGSRTFVEDNE